MGKITINELSDSLKDHIDSKQDATDNLLETNDKTVVGAINELFSRMSNNKLDKGIQFAMGTGSWETKLTGSVADRQCVVTIPTNLDFTPDYIFCLGSYHFHDNIYDNEALVENMLLSNIERGTGATTSIGIIDITPESFTVQGSYTYNSGYGASK